MKKFASLAVASLLIIQLLIPAFAASAETKVSSEGSASMKISTSTTAEYTLSFPADITIPWESATCNIGEVKAVKMLVEPKMAVLVDVTSQNDFKLIHETSAIPYTLLAAGAQANQFSFGAGDIGKTVPLSVQISPEAWANAASGKHNDKLTFTVHYVEAKI